MWICEAQDDNDEWWTIAGNYDDLPSPDQGGTPEMVIEAEKLSADRAGVTYNALRAEWMEEE